MENKDYICSSESRLFFASICSVGLFSILEVIGVFVKIAKCQTLYQVGEINPIHAASNASQVKIELDTFFGASDSKPQPVETVEPTQGKGN